MKFKNKEQEKDSLAGMTAEQKTEIELFMFDALSSVTHGKFSEEKLKDKGANNYFIQGDGMFLIHKTRAGMFGKKIADFKIPGLPCPLKNGAFIKWYIPKIPLSIYQQIITFFKAVMAKEGGAEAFLQVYWNIQEKHFEINVPQQSVSPGAVHYDPQNDWNIKWPEKYIFAYECHSHNSMPAFFSGTDNRDEKITKAYGVYGNLNTPQHTEKYRVIINNHQIDLNYDHIFDFKKEELHNRSIIIDSFGEIFCNEHDIKQVDAYQTEFPESWMKSIVNDRVANNQEPKAGGRTYGKIYQGNRCINDETERQLNFAGIGMDYNGMDEELEAARAKRDAARNQEPIGMDDTPAWQNEREEDLAKGLKEFMDEIHDYAENLVNMTSCFTDPEATTVFLAAIDDHGGLQNLKRSSERFIPQT